MRESNARRGVLRGMLLASGVCTSLLATGCQVDIGGQTLPSGFYQDDDVQYFAPGPEFKLAREAAAMKTYAEEAAQQQQGVEARQQMPSQMPIRR